MNESPSLQGKLFDSALMVLRRHGISQEDVQIEENEPGKAAYVLIRGHRVRLHLNALSAEFRVRSGQWSGACRDFPSTGSFLAAFEAALDDALAGR